jgi:hypothetical protein
MTDPVDLDLRTLTARRNALDALETRRTTLRVELDTRTAELERLRREGQGRDALQTAERRVADLVARRDDLNATHQQLVGEVGDLANRLVTTDEAAAVTSLDAQIPVAMLPVRIETRFAPDQQSLAIRIYPDQIHLDAHEPELTDDEREGGQWYWQQRWPAIGDAALATAAWETIAGRFRPGRARYLVDTLRPTNLQRAGTDAAPTFPRPPRRAAAWTRPIEATALPERWVAVGYQTGADGTPVEVFRRWSTRVPDRLAAGPSPAAEDAPPPARPDATIPRVQDSFRWALDPDSAGKAGMLLTVTDRDLPQGRRLANGLSRLVVFGVDWTLTPAQAAGSVEALLRAHAATGDLAFVAPATPTNNTGTSRSGFSSRPSDQLADWAPPVTGVDPDAVAEAAAGRLAAALGITAEALAPVPGAGQRHHQWSAALVDALWEATAGYYLSDLLQPLGSDELTAALREYAAAHLHAAGPLPTVRVGPQPYGVLPVVAGARFQPTRQNRAEVAIAHVGGRVRSLWAPLVARVPHLGRAGEQRTVDELMLDLLQRTPVPWALRWREMVPPPQWSSTDWMQRFHTYQAPFLFTLMTLLGVSNTHAAKVQYLTAAEDSYPLPVPFVLKGNEGTAYLGEIGGLARGGSAGRQQLNLRQNSIALLEALLAYAACQELDKGATAELSTRVTATVAEASGLTRRGVRTPDLVRVETPDRARQPFAFTTARELATTVAPGTNVPLHDQLATRFVNARLTDLIRDRVNPGWGLARFLAALDVLRTAPADELEVAFRGVLDLYSTRLDAWFTSLAHSRLERHRGAKPSGVHLGCYGWVENLRPDRGPGAETLGHVTAPSLAHATAAAVLRSGRQSHADSGAFDIDLSSARVREATALLEGVAAGQSIAALVGYRIERGLRDAGVAELTVPLRLVAPLQARDHERDEPVESMAARDVVDGVRLLQLFAGSGWNAVMARLGVTGQRRNRLEDVLRQVAARYDAVADVLFAEAVHQTADGNLVRASAAAAALDRQERPVELDITRTPRTGAVVTNRVLVALIETQQVQRWPARGPRGKAEPRLDRWLGTVLGPAGDLAVKGTLVRPGPTTAAPETRTDLGSVSASDLGLSPLALVLTAHRPASDRPSELEARVVAVLAPRVRNPTPEDRIELEDTLLRTLTEWASRLAGGVRPLAPTDLALAQTTAASAPSPGKINIGELRQRANAAVTAVRTAASAFRRAARAPAALRTALQSVAELAGVEAIPVVLAGHPEEATRLAEQADRVQALLDDTLARLDALRAQPEAPDADPTERPLELIRLALGAHQPVLPVFTLSAPSEVAASLADRQALLGGDGTAPAVWLHRSALVRPDLDPLCGLLLHAEAGGADVAGQVAVAQLPHRPGARWCELPFGQEGPPPAGTVGLAVLAPSGFNPARPVAGLAVDAWPEVIPAPEHTAGVTFHYDAPGARPPQAVVLAVHPLPDPTRWDLDTLLDTVNETAELAQLRTLSLKEIEGFAGLLPALYLPNNYTRDVPSVSFKGLIELAEAKNLLTGSVASHVLGKA